MINTVLFTTREVADILKIKETTVRNQIKLGKIAAVKTIGGWRIKGEELERLMRGK